MVTARMPVSAKPGTRLDVTVSSVGDATSLLGGVLLQTALKGVDGKIYTLAHATLVKTIENTIEPSEFVNRFVPNFVRLPLV